MKKTIPCSKWKYKGHGSGRGQIHRVIEIDSSGWVTTSSEFLSKETQHTWRGPSELFYSDFTPIVPDNYDGDLGGVLVVPD